MTSFTSRFLAAALVLFACLTGHIDAEISPPGEDGVVVTVDAGRKLRLPYPTLLNSAGKRAGKLLSQEAAGSTRRLRYEDGSKGEVSVAGKVVTFHFTKTSQDVANLHVELSLGFVSMLGAKWRADGGEYQAFPEQKPDKPHILQGHKKVLEILYVTGEELRIEMPKNTFAEVTDLREWGQKKFILKCQFPVNLDAPTYTFGFRVKASSSTAPKFIIDKFGQYSLKDWPAKIRDEAELKADVAGDEEYYANLNPPAFDRFGGQLGSREKLGLEKTGFFHLQQKGKRWYLVNPDGNWFFHLGVCSFASSYASTYFKGREQLYEWIPELDGPFHTARGRPGDGSNDGEVNYLIANRIRKFGVPYDYQTFTADMISRVRKFGFNSTGAFGSGHEEARAEAGFPYVAGLPVQGVPILSREVWDPFEPKVRAALEKNLARLTERADDPLLIGRFVANEPLLEDVSKLVPGYGEEKACKVRLVRMLEEKYGDIGAFNTAWKANLPSFSEAAKQPLTVKNQAAANDMEAFKDLFVEEYFSLTTSLMRKYDPNHLILGCRLQSGTINSESLCRIGSKYVDVWSFNYYTYGIDKGFLEKIATWTGGKPMILSEFYWSAYADSGLAGGVKDVRSQEERGLAYRNYVEQAAQLPYIIGVEWFTLVDASQTGVGFAKYGGENPNSGLFSVADRPWKPMIAEMIKTNYNIYQVASGEQAPFAYDDIRFSGKMQGGNTVTGYKVATPLVIDGQGIDWPGLPAERIGAGQLMNGKDAAGFEAAFKVCWDDQFLYLLADVIDDTPMMNQLAGDLLWKGDGVELFFGSEELGKGGSLLFTDRQLLISAASGEVYFAKAPAQFDCQVKVVLRPGGYTLEAAIPWTGLAAKPSVDGEFLFNLAIDDSLEGRKRDKQLMWNGNDQASGDRSQWGRLRLLGQ